MTCGKSIRCLVLPALLGVAGAADAGTDCREKLAEVDSRMAATELGPSTAGMRQIRDQAAAFCGQGQEPMAMQLLAMLEMGLSQASAQPSKRPSAPPQTGDTSQASLGNEFLAGTWCSMTGDERAQLVFSADGTYRVCLPDAVLGPYGACSNSPRLTTEWLERYPRVQSKEQDTIVLGGRRGNAFSTFKRGECSRYGR